MSVVVGISGLSLNDDDVALLTHPLVSGVILFTRNYQDPAQLAQLTTAIKILRSDLFIGVDQEGGRIQRFRDSFTPLPSFAAISAHWSNDPDKARSLAYAAGYVMAYELAQYQIDFSFTPVLDLDRGLNTVIGDRSFGADPSVVVALASELCRAITDVGMLTIGKHFPGHGGVSADTHLTEAIDDRDIDAIQNDIFPFVQLIEQGVLGGIMPAHVIYSQIDPKPAGFASKWLHDILRQRLHFEGSIFSDCLTMQAANVEGGMAIAAKMALTAGCDYILICNELEKIPAVLSELSSTQTRCEQYKPVTIHCDETVYQQARNQIGDL